MMDCAQLAELYEAYALGALEGPELAELEAHLARNCPVCTPGVESARWLVSQLALAAPQHDPPAAARARLMDAVRAEAKPAARPSSSFPAWVWLPLAAALLFAVYTMNQNRKLEQDIAQLDGSLHSAEVEQHELQIERERYTRAMVIIAAPGTQKVELKSAAPDMPALSAYVHAKMGVVIDARNVPMPPAGRTFQLWMVPKTGMGAPVSMGMYMPDKGGHVLTVAGVPSNMANGAALAVTEEPDGGSAQPTSKPIWVGPLG
jgi:anti-sigma-K factor RskA